LGAQVHLKRRRIAMGVDDVINIRRYIRIFNARRYCSYAHRYCDYTRRYCGYACRYKLLKTWFILD
jgi:hypothetical protein